MTTALVFKSIRYILTGFFCNSMLLAMEPEQQENSNEMFHFYQSDHVPSNLNCRVFMKEEPDKLGTGKKITIDVFKSLYLPELSLGTMVNFLYYYVLGNHINAGWMLTPNELFSLLLVVSDVNVDSHDDLSENQHGNWEILKIWSLKTLEQSFYKKFGFTGYTRAGGIEGFICSQNRHQSHNNNDDKIPLEIFYPENEEDRQRILWNRIAKGLKSKGVTEIQLISSISNTLELWGDQTEDSTYHQLINFVIPMFGKKGVQISDSYGIVDEFRMNLDDEKVISLSLYNEEQIEKIDGALNSNEDDV